MKKLITRSEILRGKIDKNINKCEILHKKLEEVEDFDILMCIDDRMFNIIKETNKYLEELEKINNKIKFRVKIINFISKGLGS